MNAPRGLQAFALLAALGIGAAPVIGQTAATEPKGRISLRFTSNIFSPPAWRSEGAEKDAPPEIVLFSRSGENGLGKGSAEQLASRSSENSSALKTREIVLSRDILWNFGGPLAVGFFSGEKACFVTLTIEYAWSSFAGTLGVGSSRIL
jgi:hypothetical protein